MNFTVAAGKTIRAEQTAFHTQPFGVAMDPARAPMLVALWGCDGEGRLVQTWVSVSLAACKHEG